MCLWRDRAQPAPSRGPGPLAPLAITEQNVDTAMTSR
jgi:hypothetical protein